MSYILGRGVPIDYEKGIRLSRHAYELGDSQAANIYAWGFYSGLGLPLDKERAFKLFKQSADEGNALAISNLGLCYELGDGIAQDIYKARELYERAAARDLPEALYSLALLEIKGGASTAPDMRRAVALLKQANALGSSPNPAETHLMSFKAISAEFK